MGGRSALRVAIGATLLLSAGGSIVVADDLIVDGDGVAPVAAKPLAFGNVCANSSTTRDVALVVRRAGGNGNGYANGSTVTISRGSISNSAFSAPSSAPSISLPGGWNGAPTGTMSPVSTGSVPVGKRVATVAR